MARIRTTRNPKKRTKMEKKKKLFNWVLFLSIVCLIQFAGLVFTNWEILEPYVVQFTVMCDKYFEILKDIL